MLRMWKILLLLCFLVFELNAETVNTRAFLIPELKGLRDNLHNRFVKTVSGLLHTNEEECPCPEEQNASHGLTRRRSKCHCPNENEQHKTQEDAHIDFQELGKAYHEGFLEGVRVNRGKQKNQQTVTSGTSGSDSEEKLHQHTEPRIPHQAEDEPHRIQPKEAQAYNNGDNAQIKQ